MFLLAKRVTGRPIESWIAGAVFACAPFLVARSTAHFSLVAVAPLPFFAYWLDRALETTTARRRRDRRRRAWAAYCDPYYAVYCVMLGACLIAAFSLEWSVQARPLKSAALRGVRRGIDASLVMLGVAIVAVWGIGGGAIHIGGISISMHTLYTPVLGLTVLALARVAVGVRVAVSWTGRSPRSPVRPGGRRNRRDHAPAFSGVVHPGDAVRRWASRQRADLVAIEPARRGSAGVSRPTRRTRWPLPRCETGRRASPADSSSRWRRYRSPVSP